MRIISGTHKGRRFYPPKNLPVRPTTDFAKEGLFNVLRNWIEIDRSTILDLCSGTGNMTFEFASRGAKSVLAVDQEFGCIRYIKKIAEELKLNQISTFKSELFKFLRTAVGSYDIVFVDPPYGLEGIEKVPDLILEKELVLKSGLLVVEHGRETNFDGHKYFYATRKFGNVNFTFFDPSIDAS